MFYECKVRTVGAGNNHVVVLAGATPDDVAPQFDFSLPMPEAEVSDNEESEYHTANMKEEDAQSVKDVQSVKDLREEEPSVIEEAVVESIAVIEEPLVIEAVKEASSAGSKKRSY
jgi:hypothetical protein